MYKRLGVAIILMLVVCILTACGGPEATYKSAQNLLSKGKYTEAAAKFESIGSYEDASTLAIYCKACALCESGNFETGIAELKKLGNYKDCLMRITYYTARSWDDPSVGTTEFEWMEKAQSIYNKNPLYLDSMDRIASLDKRIAKAKEDLYNAAVKDGENGKYSAAQSIFKRLDNYSDSQKRYTYYGIRADERALTADAHENSVFSVAKKYAAMGAFLDAADRAAALNARGTDILDKKYDAAIALMNAGQYADAYDAFLALGQHKDSDAKASSLYIKATKEKLVKAVVGDYVIFGAYEQDNNTSNGKEAIEWLVLARENNRLLMISRYALDCKPYNTIKTNVTWETCTLRTWLNQDFLNAAFSSAEQARIPTVTVAAHKNPDYSTNPGNSTQDKIFLLSITEAEKYFTSDSAMKCKPTAYAKKQGTYTTSNGFCVWWLRSPGCDQDYAAGIYGLGGVNEYGSDVYFFDDRAVRPALWINLEP